MKNKIKVLKSKQKNSKNYVKLVFIVSCIELLWRGSEAERI